MLKTIFIFLVKIYQAGVSPFVGGKGACRFYPSCSEYTKQAIEKYGIFKGCAMGAKRIAKCRPGGGRGFDPVP
ncbi:MAG: membrane protein insertion efficiency factor YidD [Rickettsiales bacterium]|jgi:putative membrane protein insertion efficiency factor|nr:membrane protein insertion efficiency factor YidD [Rickettsiales bacterium]